MQEISSQKSSPAIDAAKGNYSGVNNWIWMDNQENSNRI